MSAATAARRGIGRVSRRAGPVRRRERGRRTAWVFSAPFLVLFLLMYAGPLLAGLGMSFTDLRSTDVRHPLDVNGVGLDNYQRLLHDDAMRKAAWNTFFFVVTGVPLTATELARPL